MPDARIPASGTVHWVGAGLSTGSGLARLCDTAARVRLWHRTERRAADALDRLGLTGRAAPRAYTPDALTAELAPGDVVVSMLPFTSLAKGLRRRLLDAIPRALGPGGVLLVIQYSPLIQGELAQRFGTLRRRITPWNVPPAFLWACSEPRV